MFPLVSSHFVLMLGDGLYRYMIKGLEHLYNGTYRFHCNVYNSVLRTLPLIGPNRPIRIILVFPEI